MLITLGTVQTLLDQDRSRIGSRLEASQFRVLHDPLDGTKNPKGPGPSESDDPLTPQDHSLEVLSPPRLQDHPQEVPGPYGEPFRHGTALHGIPICGSYNLGLPTPMKIALVQVSAKLGSS